MNSHTALGSRGFVLLDALIAIVVVAIGIFGVVKLNSNLLASTGLAKTRAAAIQCAVDKIDECRTRHSSINPCAYTDAAGVTDQVCIGVNAVFARKLIFLEGNPGTPDNINVEVSWPGGDQPVKLNSFIANSDLGTGAAIGSGQTPKCISSEVSDPMGAAHRPGIDDVLPENPTGTAGVDGTFVYSQGGKNYLVVASSNKILLVIDDGTAFSSVEGNVYITWGSKISNKQESAITMAVVNENVRVLASAGAACVQYIAAGDPDLPYYPLSGTKKYSFFKYRCYMGSGWFGNIGIVRYDKGDRVCLGDPQVTQSDNVDSRHPYLNLLRNYRGYYYVGGELTAALGIGMTTPDGTYAPKSYRGTASENAHHFLLTTLRGTPTNSDCKLAEENVSATINPFTTIAGSSLGNTGILFCLTEQCEEIPVIPALKTYFDLTINFADNTPPVFINPIAFDGGSCARKDGSPTATTDIYRCFIDWSGWAGDFWSGHLIFNTESDLNSITIANDDGIIEINSTMQIDTTDSNIQWIDFLRVPKEVSEFTVGVTETGP